MSYILDALRKSDQQRRRGAAPTLLTLQSSAVVRKRPVYPAYGLLAVVLVAAGVVIGWLRPWQTEQAAPPRPESVAAASSESNSTETKPIETKPIESKSPEWKPIETKPLKATSGPVHSEMPVQPKPELPRPAKPQTDDLPPEANAPVPERGAAPPERRVDITAADGSGDTVITEERLPLSIRQELPNMTVSVHAYSDDPAKRLLGIGSRILREGDKVAPGLQLEEITPDGMILSYKGYRFRRGVN